MVESSGLPQRMLFSILCGLLLQGVFGDDEVADANDETEMGEDDWAFAMMSLLFGYCIALTGSIFGYVSYMDDATLKQYLWDAEIVNAEVISSELARGGTGQNDVYFQPRQKEFTVVVEYDRFTDDNYRIRIRKQIRALEIDFIHPNHPELNGEWEEDPQHIRPHVPKAPQNIKQKSPKFIFNQDSFFQQFLVEERQIEMLVLSGRPKSGMSARQISRRLGVRYRVSSALFVVASLLVTILCFRVTGNRLVQFEGHRAIGLVLMGVVVFGVIIQLPCIHFLLHDTLKKSLEDEYFEDGEVRETGQEDSSLSSGSDSFLFRRFGSLESLPTIGDDVPKGEKAS